MTFIGTIPGRIQLILIFSLNFNTGAADRTEFSTAAFAPLYSGKLDSGCMPAMLDVAMMAPPGCLFYRMKWTASCVP